MPEAIRASLMVGETVLWTGTPGSEGRLFCSEDWLLVPFSLLWGGVALTWEGLALFALLLTWEPQALLGVLVGLPFAVVGAHMIAGRFLFKAWRRKNSVYVITNKRVLIAVAGRLRAVRLNTMERCDVFGRSPNGFGNIRLSRRPRYRRSEADTGMDLLGYLQGTIPLTLYDVPDVETVHALLRSRWRLAKANL